LNVEKTRDFSIRFNGIIMDMSSGTYGNRAIVISTKEEENYIGELIWSGWILDN